MRHFLVCGGFKGGRSCASYIYFTSLSFYYIEESYDYFFWHSFTWRDTCDFKLIASQMKVCYFPKAWFPDNLCKIDPQNLHAEYGQFPPAGAQACFLALGRVPLFPAIFFLFFLLFLFFFSGVNVLDAYYAVSWCHQTHEPSEVFRLRRAFRTPQETRQVAT